MNQEQEDYTCPNDTLRDAVEFALYFVDIGTKKMIIDHLRVVYGLNLYGSRRIAPEEVGSALGLIFGNGSSAIISKMNDRLKEIASQ